MKQIKIGIIGCGTIGGTLATKIKKIGTERVTIAYLADVDRANADRLNKRLRGIAKVVSIDALIKRSDLVIEAASAQSAYGIADACLKSNTDCMVMSVGGLAKRISALKKLTRESKATLYLPSGALCGIDGVLAAVGSSIEAVSLTTRKPIKGLIGAPYFEKKKIDIAKIKKETVVFNGTAEDAIKHFPKNINVAAVLSLAGLGIKRTSVRIMTSPKYVRNSHEVSLSGAFGTITTRTDNVPSSANPKTSFMAILSAEALLKKILSPIKIGT